MSIPLVQNNEKDSINTSIIAIKRQIERINALLGLSNSEEIDTSVFATKTELEDAITQVETDLAPVDEVTVDNMQSVTSNAVAEKFNTIGEEKSGSVTSGTYTSNGTFKSENCGSITLTKGKWIVIFTMQYNGNMNTGYVIGCAIDNESYRVRVATAGIDRTLELQCAGIVNVTSASRSVDLRVFHHLTVSIASNSFVKAIRIQ